MKTEFQLPEGRVLRITQDDYPLNPRTDWDNLGNMICFHGRYDLGDNHNLEPEDYYKLKNKKDVIVLPLYLYDHSGITMSTSPFSCRWDSGQVGFIYVTHAEIRKCFGVKRVTKELKDKVRGYLEAEVETYDQYLIGDIYGYDIVKQLECSLGHIHEEHESGCGGFFGTDIKNNGLLDNLSEEDRKAIEKELKENEVGVA